MIDPMIQTPAPGTCLLKFCGDALTFTLILPEPRVGKAWIRTNIGMASVRRREIIREVNHDEVPLDRDWHDIPMRSTQSGEYRVTLPLTETGHFEGKCFFVADGEKEPAWPQGPNVEINVAPAHTCCGNTLYNAFVRQFGPNKKGRLPSHSREDRIRELDREGFAVIPPSGTFRDLIEEVDFIIGTLGCRIIQLLPVHPTPTTYGRMGRFGSPYASLSFTQVDPALARFDPKATPLDQFMELVDAVHRRNAKLFIDIAVNHTGWAASLHETHPQWLAREPNGEIEVPGAWGVRWADLTRLDYRHTDLWKYMADIFLTWCKRGVDGFRCDAGYMIPQPAWTYIIAKVKEQFPDTVFVLEGLGGKISVTRSLMNRAGFDWAYSELFQNYHRNQIEHYLPESIEISEKEGTTIHFAETHDNDRLASRSPLYAKMRTALCALLSFHGAFGFANGVEWHATEKIDVHDANSLGWGNPDNQVAAVGRLNAILSEHPAFFDGTQVDLVQKGEGNYILLARHHIPTGKRLLVAANLDVEKGCRVVWHAGDAGFDRDELTDLLTGKPAGVYRNDDLYSLPLEPGQVACFTPEPDDLDIVSARQKTPFDEPLHVVKKRLCSVVLEVFRHFHGDCDLGRFATEKEATALQADPADFCRRMNPDGDDSPVITWQWPKDLKRVVMVPPGFFLLILVPQPFMATIESGDRVLMGRNSLASSGSTSYFTLFPPLTPQATHRPYHLKMTVHGDENSRHEKAPLLYLTHWDRASVQTKFGRNEIESRSLSFLCTNKRGGMLRAHAHWGEVSSRYDALLAANLDPGIPGNRRIMFTRCRAWVVFQGYSQALTTACLTRFRVDDRSRGIWDFTVPTGQGEAVRLRVTIKMTKGENAIRIVFNRAASSGDENALADEKPIKLILRPDIEDRDFHDTTKAYTGPETDFPDAVTPGPDRFLFAPATQRRLEVALSTGSFVPEPEWQYMIHRAEEAGRGLDPDSDLFSPGYFQVLLNGGHRVVMTARVVESGNGARSSDRTDRPVGKGREPDSGPLSVASVLASALDDFVVRRDQLKTVIAGYPWFLDWGRDSLIAVRGLVEAERLEDARQILEQFGRFEKHGTIPNMIQGHDAGNRDTSDAPLWFAVACRDLLQFEPRLMEMPCGNRTFREVVTSIGHAYRNGTENGIRMDSESGLVFSPAHFTWMDTDHPAGTPRQGYPVEIQALWVATLQLLMQVDDNSDRRDWQKIAHQVKSRFSDLFWNDEAGHLADCLHCEPGIPARLAAADDALRPNQILAVTMGAVTETGMCRSLLESCLELLVPGGIRSLADRPVGMPLAIRHNGQLLNDPHHPYQGRYRGEEDRFRKPAYHNGTAWTWPFPSFCEAWASLYGQKGRETALNWLGSATVVINSGCVKHVPEILDGDAPHTARGCDAQAWGASELLRVWLKLTGDG